MESRGRAGIQAPLTFDQFCFWILRLNLFWHPVALPTLDFQHSSASLSLHRGLGLTSSNRHSIASVSLHRGLGLKSSNGHTACCGFGSEGRWLGRHFMNCCELDHYLIIQPFQPFLSQRGLGSFCLKQCFKLNISGLNLFVLPFPSFFFVLLLFAGPTVQVYNPLLGKVAKILQRLRKPYPQIGTLALQFSGSYMVWSRVFPFWFNGSASRGFESLKASF